jgi:hypothetical protein
MLFDDHVNSRMWIGMLLVVCGVTLVAQGSGSEQPVEHAAGGQARPR